MNRGQEKNRRPRNQFEGNCFSCGRKGPRPGECKNTEKIETSRDVAMNKKGRGRVKCHVCESESTLRTSTVTCARVLNTGLAIGRSEKLRRP